MLDLGNTGKKFRSQQVKRPEAMPDPGATTATGSAAVRLCERTDRRRWLVGFSAHAGDHVRRRIADSLGTRVPETGRAVQSGVADCLWLSPVDWLVVAPCPDSDELHRALQRAAASQSVIVVEASSGLLQHSLTGPRAVELLNKGCALNFAKFPPGSVTRCRFASTTLVIQRTAETEFQLFSDYSLSDYFETWFEHATAEYR